MSDAQAVVDRLAYIKRRRLEIAAMLAGWKRDYFVDGTQRSMADRSTLEAEAANLALEERMVKEAAHAARIELRRRVDHDLLREMCALLKERGLSDLIREATERSEAATTPEAIAEAIERTLA